MPWNCIYSFDTAGVIGSFSGFHERCHIGIDPVFTLIRFQREASVETRLNPSLCRSTISSARFCLRSAMSTKRRLSDPVDNNSKRSKSTHDDQQHHLSYSSSSQTRPVAFQQPSPLVTFSYDPLRVLEFDDSALRYYVDPPPGADLKYGYDKWIKRPEEKGRIDGLLKAWLKAKEQLPEESMKGAVISWRGVMTK